MNIPQPANEAIARQGGHGTKATHETEQSRPGPTERAHTARTLLESTALALPDVAALAGFSGRRAMASSLTAAFGAAPQVLRAQARTSGTSATPGEVTVRLGFTAPMDFAHTLTYLRLRTVPAFESTTDTAYTRTIHTAGGPVRFTLRDAGDAIECHLELRDTRDIEVVLRRIRFLLDLDADPVAIDALLSSDPAVAALVLERPGLRSPGAVDGFEIAVRGIIGQQISVQAARTRLNQIVTDYGSDAMPDGPAKLFPTPAQFAAINPEALAMPRSRARSLIALAETCASGGLTLGPDADRDAEHAILLALHGIGPWTAEYIRMRAMGDPDILLTTDLGLLRAAQKHGISLEQRRADISPWRSYLSNHLWAAHPLTPGSPHSRPTPEAARRSPTEVRTERTSEPCLTATG